MAITLVTLTADPQTLVGADPTSPVRFTIRTNTEGAIVDATGKKLYLGSYSVNVNGSGTLSETLVPTNAATNPTDFQYQVDVEYVDAATKKRATWHSGWFSLTAGADLAEVIAAQYVPPTYITTLTQQLDAHEASLEPQLDAKVTAASGYADDAAASAQQAHDVSNIDTSDGVMKTVDADPSSQFRQQQDARQTAMFASKDIVAPRWTTATVYTAGQPVVSPDGALVTAKAAHTSGTTFNPDNWTPTALVQVQKAVDGWLDRVGFADQAIALASSRARYEDAATFTEAWANLTAWSTNNLTAAGGYVYRDTAATGTLGANHSFALAATETLRLKANIEVPASAATGANSVFVGVSTDAAGATFASANLIGIGVRDDGHTIAYIGSAFGGVGNVQLSGSVLPVGTYYVSVIVDASVVSLVIGNAAGTIEFSTKVTRPANIGNVTVFAGDNRVTPIKIGKLGVRKDIVTVTPRAGIEGLAPTGVYSVDSASQNFRVTEPVNYDSRKPAPLVMFVHGKTGNESTLTSDPNIAALRFSLLNAGFIVSQHNYHGDAFGNQNALDDMVRLYKYIHTQYAAGPVVLLGQSMGGLASLNAITHGTIPVAGWAGLYPACSLQQMYTDNLSGDAAAIRTAYGIASDGSDYATKTSGYDPMLADVRTYRGLPMRFYASPADTRVPKATHSDKLAARVSTLARESTVVTCSGNHGDPSHYQASDLLAFFNRCVGVS